MDGRVPNLQKCIMVNNNDNEKHKKIKNISLGGRHSEQWKWHMQRAVGREW